MIDCSGNVNKCEQGITISLLVRLSGNHQNESIIKATSTDDPTNDLWCLVRESEDTLSFTIRRDGRASSVLMKFKTGLWYQYTFVLSSKQRLRLYINGRRIKNADIQRRDYPKVLDLSSSADIVLGAKGNIIDANYDEVRLWHQALRASEVASNYEKILSKF